MGDVVSADRQLVSRPANQAIAEQARPEPIGSAGAGPSALAVLTERAAASIGPRVPAGSGRTQRSMATASHTSELTPPPVHQIERIQRVSGLDQVIRRTVNDKTRKRWLTARYPKDLEAKAEISTQLDGFALKNSVGAIESFIERVITAKGEERARFAGDLDVTVRSILANADGLPKSLTSALQSIRRALWTESKEDTYLGGPDNRLASATGVAAHFAEHGQAPTQADVMGAPQHMTLTVQNINAILSSDAALVVIGRASQLQSHLGKLDTHGMIPKSDIDNEVPRTKESVQNSSFKGACQHVAAGLAAVLPGANTVEVNLRAGFGGENHHYIRVQRDDTQTGGSDTIIIDPTWKQFRKAFGGDAVLFNDVVLHGTKAEIVQKLGVQSQPAVDAIYKA